MQELLPNIMQRERLRVTKDRPIRSEEKEQNKCFHIPASEGGKERGERSDGTEKNRVLHPPTCPAPLLHRL